MTGLSPTARRTLIRQPGEGEANGAFALPRRLLVTAEDTEGALSMWVETVPPGSGPPLHRHDRQRELFQVLGGRLLFECDGERVEVGQGTVLLVPPGVAHAFSNVGDETAEIMVTMTPGGFEGFFREVEARGLTPHADMPAIVDLAARYDLVFTGPPLAP
jgi:quercetin dioxygenase-like cupin family protein